MVAASWVEPTSTIQIGRAKTTTAAISRAWASQALRGVTPLASVAPRASVTPGAAAMGASVVDTAFDEAELDGREADDDQHQDHRLRRGGAEVEVHPSVDIGAVDQ